MTIGEKMIWAAAFNDALKEPTPGAVTGGPRMDPIRAAAKATFVVKAYRFAQLYALRGPDAPTFDPDTARVEIRDLFEMLRGMDEEPTAS